MCRESLPGNDNSIRKESPPSSKLNFGRLRHSSFLRLGLDSVSRFRMQKKKRQRESVYIGSHVEFR